MEPKYKIGDKFKFGSGDREIVGVHVDTEGAVKYLVDFNNGDTCDLLTEEYIELRYRKIEPFFEVGKTYQFSKTGDKYKVIDVREVDGEKFAWSEERGLCHFSMTTLNEYNFKQMTEV